uniref:Protein kinase domain-containing protein n=1 Tax=Oryza rufipogon TaxID=4529 RepID=A0A0E0R9Z9_ORYRU
MRQHKVVVVEAALLPHIHGEVAIAVLGPQRLLDPLLPGGLLDGLLVMGLGGGADAAAHGERRGGAGFAADAFSSGDEIDEDAVVELGEADPVSRKRRKEKEKKKRRKEKRKQRKWAPPDKDETSLKLVFSFVSQNPFRHLVTTGETIFAWLTKNYTSLGREGGDVGERRELNGGGDILSATEHFNDAYSIGKGSFGTVYSADLGGGRTDLGMKRLDASETGDACCGS